MGPDYHGPNEIRKCTTVTGVSHRRTPSTQARGKKEAIPIRLEAIDFRL